MPALELEYGEMDKINHLLTVINYDYGELSENGKKAFLIEFMKQFKTELKKILSK